VRRPARIAALLSLFGPLVAAAPAQAQQPYGQPRAQRHPGEPQEPWGRHPYRAGQPIDPAIESANQPNCSLLPDWSFMLGTGYASRAVSGPWGS
jgi:hypothetical protein